MGGVTPHNHTYPQALLSAQLHSVNFDLSHKHQAVTLYALMGQQYIHNARPNQNKTYIDAHTPHAH